MPALTLDRLEKRYPGHVAASSVSLSVHDGEFISLLGPSGCGKTTVLRMVAGLIEPTGGRILVDGRDITALPTNRRNIGLVFQSYALFPHMSVFENVAFGLRRQGMQGSELKQRVDQALASVRLSALGDRMPKQLSGGQQQRVAVARSITPRPAPCLRRRTRAASGRRPAAPRRKRHWRAPRVRHARPGRGHVHVRPRVRARARRGAAVRHARGHLPPPRHRLRRQLHRPPQPAHRPRGARQWRFRRGAAGRRPDAARVRRRRHGAGRGAMHPRPARPRSRAASPCALSWARACSTCSRSAAPS